MADGHVAGTTIGNILSGGYLLFQGVYLMSRADWQFWMTVVLFFAAFVAHITTIYKNTKK